MASGPRTPAVRTAVETRWATRQTLMFRETWPVSVFRNTMDGQSRKHRILMVSDFFFPNFGGVESHIYYLSQCLLKLRHKVVVMTHAYGKRSGVRYVTDGLKVYYVPWRPFLMQNTLPTLFMTFPIIRTILIREKISVVHGHQAFSTMCHEALMHARTMGYKVVFTDHSLYGFADVGSIHMNKVLQFTLADIDQAICVSHTSKENTVLRLVYRKGADLLVEVIPEVCHLFPKVRFIVGGDGPKRVRLEEMREKFSLQNRVEMLGAVPRAQVLPDDMIVLAEPDPEDMVRAVRQAIDILPGIDPQIMHRPPAEGIEEVSDIGPLHIQLDSADDQCEMQRILTEVVVPEWLSGMTRNHVGFARAGSNPADHVIFASNVLYAIMWA
ncbi:Phosphatidylinositol N-acetylglucosaminyltransferase subunit A [Triticum urartu]|uniref:phosphatidylinositol N-acetylglucosaminyltransferase n=2 Tax=Triticum urartu TaxID=4572 RepID=M8AAQ0_TRIUA|nr:Phosphatidylinositol N-acetylglucosaminyltransferase subunit A [Triticum urartu]